METEQEWYFLAKSFYNHLVGYNNHSHLDYSAKLIWNSHAPPRISFFAWEAPKGRILTIDNLTKRGVIMVNRCYLCKSNLETPTICFCSVWSLSHFGLISSVSWAYIGLPLVWLKGNYLLGRVFVGKTHTSGLFLLQFLDHLDRKKS